MRLRIFPLRWRSLLTVFVGVGLVTGAQTTGVFGWAPVRWTEVSALARVCLFATGPLVCIVGSWAARVNTTVATAQAPGRPWSDIVWRHLLVVGVAVTAGYVAGLMPAFVLAGRRATEGGPDLLVIISGLSGLLVFLALGYLVGSLVAAPVGLAVALATGFFAGAGLFLISDLLTVTGAPLSLFSVIPFWQFPLSRGSHEFAQIAGFRAVVLTGLALLLGLLASRLLELGRGRRRARRVSVARTLGPVVALAAVAVAVQPDITRSAASPAITCRDLDRSSLCMYAEEDALLSQSAGAIGAVMDRFGPGALTGRFTSVRIDQLREPLRRGDLIFTPQVDSNEEWFEQSLTFDTARGISGSVECEEFLYERHGVDYVNTAPLGLREGEVFGQMLAAEIATRMGFESAETFFILPSEEQAADTPATRRTLEALGAATGAELRRFVNDRAADLGRCSVGPGEFSR